jgi:AcrR family transcriptional regulator
MAGVHALALKLERFGTHSGFYRHFTGKDELYAAAVRQFLCKKTPAPWQKRREPSAVTKPDAQRIEHLVARGCRATHFAPDFGATPASAPVAGSATGGATDVAEVSGGDHCA